MLRVRVKDDQVRELGRQIAEGVDNTIATSYDEVFALATVAFKMFDGFNDRVSELLRTTY